MTTIYEFKTHLIRCASEKKGIDIREYDVKKNIWHTDYILVIGVSNAIHCKSMVNEISHQFNTADVNVLSEIGVDSLIQSGKENAGWVILDMGNLIIHCISVEQRAFYKLDELYEVQGTVFHH